MSDDNRPVTTGTVDPIPEGYHTVTPYLIVEDGDALIRFAQAAFDATLAGRSDTPDGRLMHADLKVGDSHIMLGESNDEWGPTRSLIHLYVPDVDAVFTRAIEAGARSIRDPETMFYGDRTGGVEDPSGTQWWIATRVEVVSPEEIERRQRESAEE
jgi:PhnB protein